MADAEATTRPGSRRENYADDFGHFRRPGCEAIYSALRGGMKYAGSGFHRPGQR